MNKPRQSYQQIRCELKNLINTFVHDPTSVSAGKDLKHSQEYLHDHCSECGCAITGADYAQVYERECVRVGSAGEAKLEEQPICLSCYARLRRTLSTFAPDSLGAPKLYADSQAATMERRLARRLSPAQQLLITQATHRSALPYVQETNVIHPRIKTLRRFRGTRVALQTTRAEQAAAAHAQLASSARTRPDRWITRARAY